MYTVQHVEMKSVFSLESKKRPVSTTVENGKPAVTFRIIFLRTKNQQLSCLVVMVYIVLQERRVVFTKKKIQLHF